MKIETLITGLEKEHATLMSKVYKLAKFNIDKGHTVDNVNRLLLVKQQVAMESYLATLAQRVVVLRGSLNAD